MEIDHCVFPDDLLYDVENNTWLRRNQDETVTVGVTSLLSALAGRLVRATLKTFGTSVARGQSLGTLESEKFVGPVHSPISGKMIQVNQSVRDNPRTINTSPYESGWIATLRPDGLQREEHFLQKAPESRIVLAQKIAQLHIRCFRAFPDRDLYEIGTECSAVIVRLNEALATMPAGEVLHLVSDDPTAYVEMMAWSDRTGQSVVDWRREGNLFHFIIRKVR